MNKSMENSMGYVHVSALPLVSDRQASKPSIPHAGDFHPSIFGDLLCPQLKPLSVLLVLITSLAHRVGSHPLTAVHQSAWSLCIEDGSGARLEAAAALGAPWRSRVFMLFLHKCLKNSSTSRGGSAPGSFGGGGTSKCTGVVLLLAGWLGLPCGSGALCASAFGGAFGPPAHGAGGGPLSMREWDSWIHLLLFFCVFVLSGFYPCFLRSSALHLLFFS